jgi:hypothetical protein
LFVGALGSSWKTGWQRCQELKRLGHNVFELAEEPYIQLGLRRFLRHLDGEAFPSENVRRFNADLIRNFLDFQPDMVWLDKCLMTEPGTLIELKKCRPRSILIANQDDNPFGERHHEKPSWARFVESIPLYDVQLVKRPSDVKEFSKRGVQRALMFVTGYFDELVFPEPSAAWELPVAFAGTQFDDRAAQFKALICKKNIPIRIYGDRWKRTWLHFMRRNHFGGIIGVDDLRRLMSSAKIMLNFPSKSNLDQYNGRSFDIPACRGFLLAERTPSHQAFFNEGEEAEFFSDIAECADKIRFYLCHEAERTRIAANGYQRCLSSGYNLRSRISKIMSEICAVTI